MTASAYWSVEAVPPAGGIVGLDVAPTYAFDVTEVDGDGDGRIDSLVVGVGVNVTASGGQYRVEGLLVDEYGAPAAWSVSGPQSLGLGAGPATY